MFYADRLFDTYIPKKRELDNLTYQLRDIKRLRLLVALGELLGMLRDSDKSFALTRKGTFWIHLIQNYFSLRWINRIWTKAKCEAWPAFIKF